MQEQNKILVWLKAVTAILVVFSTLSVLPHQVEAATKANKAVNRELLKKGTLTVGLEGTYAPYSYRKNGKLTGFEVDLARQIAKKSHLQIRYVPTKWDSLIAGLGSQRFDAVLNDITITPQRRKQFSFSTPYIFSRSVLITRSGDKSIKSVKDIKNKRFAEGTGTNNEILAKRFGARTVPSGDFDTSLSLIRENRVQGTINAREAWFAYSKQRSTRGLKYRVIPSSQDPAAQIAVLLNKQSPQLRKQINKALKEIRKDGQLARLSKKYFGADITK